MTSPRPGPARRALATALVLAVTATPALVACSADDDPGGPRDGRGGQARDGSGSGAAPVRTRVQVGEVVGGLGPVKRRRVATGVARAVDRWWDAAFIDGSYPRRRYGRAFPGFTAGAGARARRDLDQMTSHRIGERVERVTAVRRRVVVDILATRQTARAVTARTTLDYRTRGEARRLLRVHGRLFLVYRDGWRIFGYDVTQGPKPVTAPEKQSDKQPDDQSGKKPGTQPGKKRRTRP
ncbi:hypothetical protein I601_3949 [Nocardioides dokdonensis FR1436]|uniref:SnoaL-like domain-containing protein n=1 Tax=Nocardioides dokdonensis FR1436 TaxID=1300347 RepID=A0A1A9GQJ9_9ACTN|nr:hypothetical protein [Nocardioides dokdonensis]ANH40346.1 hypothetical protein I601_3949 [Nocardioides dokdonensis FR1436]